MQGNLLHTVVAILLVAGISFLLHHRERPMPLPLWVTNPVSGMTLTTLILASVVMVAVGLKGPRGMVAGFGDGRRGVYGAVYGGRFHHRPENRLLAGKHPVKQENVKFLGTIVSAATVGGVMIILNKTTDLPADNWQLRRPTQWRRLSNR